MDREPASSGSVHQVTVLPRPYRLPKPAPFMSELIIIGDRVLIEPQEGEQKTSTGLLLPAGAVEQENVRGGRVVKTGPGYLTQNPEYSENDSWRPSDTPVRYLPLQAEPGDYAFFVRSEAVELRYEDSDYLIIPHSAILALVRQDETSEEKSDTTLEDIEDLWDDDE
jgi:co-chaperonin GroES (HSP10)